MRRGLRFDHIFPIRDAASAGLARVKADCLLVAGVIGPEEHKVVYGHSAVMLDYARDNPSWAVAAERSAGDRQPMLA